MQVLDLFNTKFEQDLKEGAVDRLEQRHIENLNSKMDDLLARAKQANTPEHRAALKREFDKVKNERDSYFQVREAGIGHDIVNKTEKMARATPPTRAGAVASTVKNAAKWLAGKGGPGKEGPTYEGAEDIADRGEYDHEGDMAKDNIHTIVRNAKELESILGDNDNLPEWVQDKLANIKGMMTAVSDYMQTQHEREHEEAAGEEGITMAEWKKEGDWKEIPKSKTGKPVDPRGEVTHLSDVARRETLRKLAQKKNSKEVEEDSKPRDLAAAIMLKKAHAAFPIAKNDAEALALWIADKEQRDVNRLEKENEQEEEMIARIIDQLKSKDLEEHGGGGGGPREWHSYVRSHRADEGWSDRIVAQRTGQPRTPYSVYIKGRKWKDFENEDHAEAVANKLRAKFKAEGRDPSVITIAPTDYDKDIKEDIGSWIVYDPETKQIRKRFKTHTAGKSYAKVHGLGFASSEYYFDNIKPAVTAEGMTDFQKRRQRERDVDMGKPVAKQRTPKQTDYQKRRAEQKRQDELGEEKTRLDPKCWKGKKIGTPKTKMKGGVRVNNCVPAESVEEEAKKGLYYYVNKRKKAGTSRDKDDPRAPSAQDWKNAAKTAKKESVEEEWSEKYKRSIDCSHPKGFSQKAHCAGRKKNEGMFSTLGEDQDTSAVESAIIRRIMVAHVDWLQKFGPQKVMQAAEEVAYNVGDVDEIGTSDVSAYVHEVGQILGVQ